MWSQAGRERAWIVQALKDHREEFGLNLGYNGKQPVEYFQSFSDLIYKVEASLQSVRGRAIEATQGWLNA